MNNIILEAKSDLHKIGYCSFNLKEFDTELYNFVYKHRVTDDEIEKKNMNCLRADFSNNELYTGESVFENFKSFEQAENKKLEILEKCKEEDIFQIWYCATGKMNSKEWSLLSVYDKLTRYFYNLDDDTDLQFNAQYTMYDKGCFLKEHQDGKTLGRICVVLIYLNENYEESNGGNLILDKNFKVIPELGMVSILDLNKFNVSHEVTKVIGDRKRYTALSFVGYKQK